MNYMNFMLYTYSTVCVCVYSIMAMSKKLELNLSKPVAQC